jgi:hypothetical protein
LQLTNHHLPPEFDLWTRVLFDTWTGLRASAACGNFTSEEFAINVTDPWAVKWIRETSQGRSWAESMGFRNPLLFVPPRDCGRMTHVPFLEINAPWDGQTITTNPLDIIGKVFASSDQDFRSFRIDYTLAENPSHQHTLMESGSQVKQTDRLVSWDVQDIPAGPVRFAC